MHPYIWIPATLLLCYRAYSHASLTPAGIATAALTAVAHGIHPWNLPFVLLVIFFLAGTKVTKIKKEIKDTLTLSSTGDPTHSPRTHTQVLANSLVATLLILLHAYKLHVNASLTCLPYGGDLLPIGIIAHYACVAADTFSSELGILARESPRLITSWRLRKVRPGTNGGVTFTGLVAGLGGSAVIVAVAMVMLPFCETIRERKAGAGGSGGPGWTLSEKAALAVMLVLWGGLGSVVDSFLGGWFQASVVDKHTGKVVEGEGGKRVLIEGSKSVDLKKEIEGKMEGLKKDKSADDVRGIGGKGEASRRVESGLGVLDNNEVNFLMALGMSVGAMQVAGRYWGVPLSSILP